MPDTSASRDSAEACVCKDGNMLTEWQTLQCRGDWVDSLHASPRRAATDQHNHVSMGHRTALDCIDRRGLRNEDARRASVAINIVLVDERRVDGSALDDASLGRQIAGRKADGRGESTLPCSIRRENHVVCVDIVQLAKPVLQYSASLTLFPPVEVFIERFACHGPHTAVQQSGR